jgi:hypothetical protein
VDAEGLTIPRWGLAKDAAEPAPGRGKSIHWLLRAAAARTFRRFPVPRWRSDATTQWISGNSSSGVIQRSVFVHFSG